MVTLPHAQVISRLARALEPLLAHQEMRPRHRWRGAYVNPDWGLDDPSHVGSGVLLAAAAALAMEGPAARRDDYRRRAEAAAGYLLRVQRPSGLIDLKACNFDSAPDTAFVVQLLAAVLETTVADATLAQVRRDAEQFIRAAVPGLQGGGFHTPNHRWVIAAALAWSAALLPGVPVQPALTAYLAEGIDQDADGAYQERSSAVYDAVTDRSLWLLARHAGWAEAKLAQRRNLRLNLLLQHGDGTIESGKSRRQDRAWRVVPASLVHAYWLARDDDADGRFATAAQELWQRCPAPGVSDAFWTWYAGRATGWSSPRGASVPTRYTALLPALRLWRYRRDDLSLTVFGEGTRLLHLVAGRIELLGVTISQSYFGVGQFRADELQPDGSGVVIRSLGRSHPRRPGYDLPAGEPVPVEAWEEHAARREVRRMPPAEGRLVVTPRVDGCELRYASDGGVAGVPAQLTLDFRVGGRWSQGGRSRSLAPGEVVLLDRPGGEWRVGGHILQINPGADAHSIREMRDAEPPAPGCARIVVPLLTPADHRLRLRVRQA
jgi:hypothetical protein